MSKRVEMAKSKKEVAAQMPNIPVAWANQYQFSVLNGVTHLAFGVNGTFHNAIAIPNDLPIDLLSQLGAVLRNTLVPTKPTLVPTKPEAL